MAATGLMLVAFLIIHLAENLTLYVGENGETFVAYVKSLHALGAGIYIIESALAAVFLVHIYVAVRLTQTNNAARPVAYAVKKTFGESSIASRSMFVTGAVVLGFLVLHLVNFRFAKGLVAPHPEELRDIVMNTLATPGFAIAYVVGAIAIGIHVSHGVKSLFQSFGIHHVKVNAFAYRLAILVAILLAVGFASFPIVAILKWKGGAA